MKRRLDIDNSASRRRRHRQSLLFSFDLLAFACAALLLPGVQALAGDLRFESVGLPGLRIDGQAAIAHTQGLEVLGGKYYVTARRDDLVPKRALLLRTAASRMDWDVWDITPSFGVGTVPALDHPGGFQSDGKRLWIPIAESNRKGHSVIRVFPLTEMVRGQPLTAEFEFRVNDHIGAIAVFVDKEFVLGASWDTETIYVWDLAGQLQRTLNGPELESRGLGAARGPNSRPGLAVQDWKMVDGRLFASGIQRGPEIDSSPQNQFLCFVGFFESGFQRQLVVLPNSHGVELAREGMAISDGLVYFLPEDLGASNRVFRASVSDLMQTGKRDKG